MTHLITDRIRALNPKTDNSAKAENAIRLDLGELPYPPSPFVIKAIAEAASTMNRYPETLSDNLRDALVNYTGVAKERILVGNGSDDLIELIVKVFVDQGEEVLIPIPSFYIYWYATQLMGGHPVFVNRNDDFGLDVQSLLQKITPRVKVIFIANPNNPTGNLVSRENILEILNNTDRIVVVDECYYEICQETLIDMVGRYPNLVILRSFSKSFALAGLRLGYCIANETLVDYLHRATQPFPVNKIAQIAAIAALNDTEYMRSNVDRIRNEREKLADGLQRLGFRIYPSVTNFLFVRTKQLGIPSSRFVDALRSENIFVKDFGLKPGLDAYNFRTTVGTSDENQALLTVLTKVIDELSGNG